MGHGAGQPRPGLDIVEGFVRSQVPITQEGGAIAGRPWIQVWFACAGRYQKVFRAIDGTAYVARCPMCGKSMRFAVGAGGTNRRTFTVSC